MTETAGVARTLAVWCPDWPAVAAARQAGVAAARPVAVLHANRVRACTAAARLEGIRVGMRRREAQSRCPDLVLLPVDEDVSGRMFEPVVAAVEAVVPGIEVLRPGMIVGPARGPRRYFGSEDAVAERIVDEVEALDVEARIGVADVLAVAVLAARQQRIVPAGGDREFCAGLPIAELAREPALAPPERTQLVDLLVRLGIGSVGAFAALPEERVATRFGADALLAHRLACGRSDRGVSRRQIPDDMVVSRECDPPVDRVDTAAFLGRALAEQFHAVLADAGLACTRLTITASTASGRRLSRTWRAARPLTPAATADRLRWQLDGWLTAGRRSGAGGVPAPDGAPGRAVGTAGVAVAGGAGGIDVTGGDADDTGPDGIVMLTLRPVEAVDAGRIQYGLWGSDGAEDHRAGWAFARIQGLLGPESVLAPVLSGGRSPLDRITLVSWGDERVPRRDPSAPWPGAIPAPSPSRLADRAGDPGRVELLDASGLPVRVTHRGVLSAPPATLGVRPVVGWAGPWLVDERWWEPREALSAPGPLVAAPPVFSARMQVLCEPGPAVLLRHLPGPATPGWQLEGVYD